MKKPQQTCYLLPCGRSRNTCWRRWLLIYHLAEVFSCTGCSQEQWFLWAQGEEGSGSPHPGLACLGLLSKQHETECGKPGAEAQEPGLGQGHQSSSKSKHYCSYPTALLRFVSMLISISKQRGLQRWSLLFL